MMGSERLTSGGTARGVDDLLEKERARPADLADERATNAELVAGAIAQSTADRLDTRVARGLGAAIRRLVERRNRYRRARRLCEQGRATEGAVQQARQRDRVARSEEAHARSARANFVPPMLARAAALVIGLAEVSFWYLVWVADLEKDASFVLRLGAVVLALFVPLAGILAAALAGAKIPRLVQPVPGESRVVSGLKGGLAVAVLGVAAWLTYWLVSWRFEDHSPVGANEMPSGLLAGVFVLALVVIALMEAFADHERGEDSARERAFRRAVRRQDRLEQGELEAETRWSAAAQLLATRIDRALDEADRLVSTASVVVLASRSAREDAPISTPVSRTPGQPLARWAVGLGLQDLEVRAIARAVDALAAHAPETESMTAVVAEMRQRLRALYGPSDAVGEELEDRADGAAPADVDGAGDLAAETEGIDAGEEPPTPAAAADASQEVRVHLVPTDAPQDAALAWIEPGAEASDREEDDGAA